MKKTFSKFVAVAILASAFPSYGICSSAVTARVLQFGTYGNGNLFVSFDKPIDEAGCTMAYLELPANSPALKTALASVALAFATNALVEIKTDSCFMGVPSFSGARPTYLLLKQ